MLTLTRLTTEGAERECITDEKNPAFAFQLASDRQNVTLRRAKVSCNGWETETEQQQGIVYGGPALQPFTAYTVRVTAEDDAGEQATGEMTFETGRLDTTWQGKWITDTDYRFTEKKVSPKPMTFRRALRFSKPVQSAKLYVTAIGIYELQLNGEKVGKDYFMPGFTSYTSRLQYQCYDITRSLTGNDTLTAVVAGGWAVGAFVFTRVNRVTAPRQAFLAELRVTFIDGSKQVIGTDTDWQVTLNGNVKEAEFYDGETYDATVDLNKTDWRPAGIERVKIRPALLAQYGPAVRAHEEFKPVSVTKAKSGELIYDFGQNFAGVVRLKIKGRAGQKIVVRHAEILTKEGELNTAFLRSAKCTATYICREGVQEYMPRMTYMGFRYAGITGAAAEDLEVVGVALYSDLEQTGSFRCSNEMLNQLQSNIVWGGKSNFVDIPTDCPQRDERMGWTGDIAVFAPTACYNFGMERFLHKWLLDVKSEQTRGGAIPNTVPVQGYGFPATMPKKAIAWWGDACIYVPWALYMAGGDRRVLETMYPTMQKYLKACQFWAGLFSFGKNKYIWSDIPALQFGDWVAPDVPQMSQWQARCKWTGTAALAHSSDLLSRIAEILGKKEDAAAYAALSEKVADAYVSVLTDGNGKLLEEFQTAYVLPLQFGMFPAGQREKAAENLVRLVKASDYCIGTGFPGTPFLLFALADNGYPDVAYQMLLNTKCPSWLYEVKVGATTIWERWDGLDENGVCTIGDDGTGGMISFNHYAFGAVGDFLYRRVAGLEPISAGYRTFRVKPLLGGGLTSACGTVQTAYGKAVSDWKIADGTFTIRVEVPVGSECTLTLPSGAEKTLGSGSYTFQEAYAG